MRTTALVIAMLVLTVWTSPAVALMETDKELVNMAQISLVKAVEIALQKVPGKAYEAEIEKEDGRPAYEVKIIDTKNEKRTVHVDARTGDVLKAK
jgi:uncharacterized membrane protein YkoI